MLPLPPLKNQHLTCLLTLALIFVSSPAVAADLYTTDFENFSTGDNNWAGNDGWVSNSTSGGVQAIDKDILPALGKTASLGFNQPQSTFTTVVRSFDIDPVSLGTPIIGLETLFGIQDSTNGRHDSFFFTFYSRSGIPLASVRFNNENLTGPSVWRTDGVSESDTGAEFIPNELHLLYVEINFESNTWSVYLDDIPLFNALPFTAASRAPDFGSLGVEWQLASASTRDHGNNFILVADMKVTTSVITTASPFAIDNITMDSSGHPVLTWEGTPGFAYQVEFSDDLLSWENTLPGSSFLELTTGQTLTFTDTTNSGVPHRAYRVTRNSAR